MKNKDVIISKIIYMLISLFFAIILFFNANAVILKNATGRDNSSEMHSTTIYDMPIDLKYDNSRYFVSGFDGTANVYLTSYNLVRLTAEKSDDTRSFHLVADLSKVKEGTVEVPIRVVQLASGVNAQVDPGNISVTVEKKATKTFNVTPVVSEKLLPEGYKLKGMATDKKEVQVTSGASIITQIDRVEAYLPSDVILDNDFTGKVYLRAVDKTGKVLPAKISPTAVKMSVDVDLPNKDVPVVGKITGKKSSDMKDYTYKLAKSTVNISGEQKYIDNISNITANIDVTDIKKETTITVPLSADGVTITPDEMQVVVTPVKK